MSAVTVAINLIATDGTSAAFSAFTSSMTGAAARLQGFRGLLKGIGPEWAAMGAGLVGAAAAFELFKIPVEQGIKNAMELESQLTRLRFATQDTAEDMPLLTAAVTDLALQTMYGVGEATQAFEQLVEMGFSTQEIMYGMSDSASALMDGTYHAKEAMHGLGMESLFLGQALKSDPIEAAQLLGSVLHTFHQDGMDAAEAANYLAAAFFNGVPDVNLLAEAIRNGGAVAASVKIPFKDFAITLDLLSQAGMPAGMAATSLNYYINQLSAPTMKAAKAMSDLGIITMDTGPKFQAFEAQLRKAGAAGAEAVKGFDGSVTSLQTLYKAGQDLGLIPLDKQFMTWAIQSGFMKNAMYDANGQFVGLKDSIEILREHLAGVGDDAAKVAYIRDMFNIRGGQDARLFAIMDEFGVRWDKLEDRFNKTDLGKLAAEQLNTLAGAIDQLKDSIGTALATMFLPILPQITEFVQHISEMVQSFQELDPEVRKGIAIFLLAGTALTGLTVLVLGIIVAIAGFIAILSAAGIELGAVALGLGAVAGGVVGLGAVVAGVVALKDNISDDSWVVRFFDKLSGGMLTAGQSAQETVLDFDDLEVKTRGLQGYTKDLAGSYTGLNNEVRTAGNLYSTLHTNMKDTNDELDTAHKRLPDVKDDFKDADTPVKDVGDHMGTVATNTNEANSQFKSISESLGNLGQSLGELGGVLGQFSGLWNALGFVLLSVLGIINGIAAGVQGYFMSVIVGVVNVASGIIQIITGLFQIILGLTGDFFAVLGNLLSGNFEEARRWVNTALSHIVEGIINIISGLATVVVGLWQMTFGALAQGVSEFVTNVIEWFQDLFDTLVGHSIVPDLVNAILDWFRRLPSQVPGIVAGMVSGVTSRFSSLNSEVTGKLIQLVQTGQSKAGELKDRILSSIASLPGSAASTFQNLLGNARNTLSQLPSIGWDAGKGLVQNLINGMNNMLGGLRSKVNEVASLIKLPLGHSVPEEGPLSDDDQWGAHLIENLIGGMHSRLPDLSRAVNAVAGTVRGSFTTPQFAASNSGGGVVVIPISLDGQTVAEYVVDLTTKQVRKMGGSRYAR